MSLVLVTGGAGYVGNQVVRELLKSHRVRIFDKLYQGIQGIADLVDLPEVEIQKGDIRDPSAVKEALKDVDSVVHLAAMRGDSCETFPDQADEINVAGTMNVIGQGKELGLRMVHASTCSLYGNMIGGGTARENTPLGPIGVYALTKHAAEIVAQDAGAIILRFATAYGWSPCFRSDTIVHQFIQVAVRAQKIAVYKPSHRRALIHVKDIARGVGHFLRKGRPGEVYNLVGANYTKTELAERVAAHFPAAYEIWNPTEQDSRSDPRDYAVSGDKAAAAGFRSIWALEHALITLKKLTQGGILQW